MYYLYPLIILFFTFSLLGDESIKEKICRLEEKLVKTEEPSTIYYELALLQAKDQELDKSFEMFLLALKTSHPKRVDKFSSEDEKLYNEALKIYFSEDDPLQIANLIVSKYESLSASHPDYHLTNLLLSVAYANLGSYENFFKKFYLAFQTLPDHFLSYKTQGVLNLRLAKTSNTQEARSLREESASSFLKKALLKEPKDPNIYKSLYFISKNKGDKSLLTFVLQELASHEAKFSRGDFLLFVQEAIEQEEVLIVEKLVEKGKNLYGYSRGLNEAEEWLKQNKRI